MNYAQILIADFVYSRRDVRDHEIRIGKMICTVFVYANS